MCPVCITTAVLSAAGATSGAGIVAATVARWRTLRRRLYHGLMFWFDRSAF
jgi:hypothetical protein